MPFSQCIPQDLANVLISLSFAKMISHYRVRWSSTLAEWARARTKVMARSPKQSNNYPICVIIKLCN